MRKLALFFLLALNLPAVAQWGAGGSAFRFYISGTAAAKSDSIRLRGGGSTTITVSGNEALISSTVAAGSVDSTAISNLSVAATDLVNGAVLYAKLATGIVDSVKAKDGSLINADLRVSTLDSSRIAPSGIAQSDIRTAAVGATQLAPTAVTAGSYTSTDLTVDQDGRITAASNGSAATTVAFATMYKAGGTLTLTTNQWTKIVGMTVETSPAASNITAVADSFTTTATATYEAQFSIDFSNNVGTGNNFWEVTFMLDQVKKTNYSRKAVTQGGTAADIASIAGTMIFSGVSGTDVSLIIRNTTNTDDVAWSQITFSVKRIN